jgi:pSer/pThr/pTyr-binding forkhead associated (FHA) protein
LPRFSNPVEFKEPPVWMLRTAEDAKQPFLFRITPGNVKTVGRAPRADFVVDAALVSRLHCRLAAGAAEIEATDLKSTNGTYVNGARVDRATLRDGDRLRVGAVELLVMKTTGEPVQG